MKRPPSSPSLALNTPVAVDTLNPMLDPATASAMAAGKHHSRGQDHGLPRPTQPANIELHDTHYDDDQHENHEQDGHPREGHELWQMAHNRFEDAVRNQDAVILRPSNRLKLPLYIVPRPIGIRLCGCCVSSEAFRYLHRRESRVGCILAICVQLLFQAAVVLACLALLEFLPPQTFCAVVPLAWPHYLLWLCLLEDEIVRLIFRTPLVWVYLFILCAWAALLSHLQQSYHVFYILGGELPGFVLSVLGDGTRVDAFWFRLMICAGFASSGVVVGLQYFLLVFGRLPIVAPFDLVVNFTSVRMPVTTPMINGSLTEGGQRRQQHRDAASAVNKLLPAQVTVFSEFGTMISLMSTLLIIIGRFIFVYFRQVLRDLCRRRGKNGGKVMLRRHDCAVIRAAVVIQTMADMRRKHHVKKSVRFAVNHLKNASQHDAAMGEDKEDDP